MLKISENLKFLRKRSGMVSGIDAEIKVLVLDMIETMNTYKGVGLAAPQVGVLKRIIVIKIDDKDIPLINPLITGKSKETDLLEEGCLSLPGRSLEIKRFTGVDVKALDIDGNELNIKLEGLVARIFQHELDHLDGKLILDRVSLIQRIKNFFRK